MAGKVSHSMLGFPWSGSFFQELGMKILAFGSCPLWTSVSRTKTEVAVVLQKLLSAPGVRKAGFKTPVCGARPPR